MNAKTSDFFGPSGREKESVSLSPKICGERTKRFCIPAGVGEQSGDEMMACLGKLGGRDKVFVWVFLIVFFGCLCDIDY